jgi:hypothetical protein
MFRTYSGWRQHVVGCTIESRPITAADEALRGTMRFAINTGTTSPN